MMWHRAMAAFTAVNLWLFCIVRFAEYSTHHDAPMWLMTIKTTTTLVTTLGMTIWLWMVARAADRRAR